MKLIVFFLSIFAVSHLQSQDTIRVPSEVTTIQAALDIANAGTLISVAPGAYYETIRWPYKDSIMLVSEEGALHTIIDAEKAGRVLDIRGGNDSLNGPQTITAATMVSGFTLKNGYLLNAGGAGIFTRNASPYLRDLKVCENHSQDSDFRSRGGGGYFIAFEGLIEDCTFVDNELSADDNGFQNLGFGGGIYMETLSNVELRNCTIRGNKISGFYGCEGGGFMANIYEGSSVNQELFLNNCVVENNVLDPIEWAHGNGLSIKNLRIDSCDFINNRVLDEKSSCGGAIYAEGKVEIGNSSFEDNMATSGAGIFLEFDSPYLDISKTIFNRNTNSSFSSIISVSNNITRIDLANCVISNNIGFSLRGPDQNALDPFTTISVNNCTVVNNTGGVDYRYSIFTATNSIFWNNGIKEILSNSEGRSYMRNCIIQGDTSLNNYNLDPLFVSASLYIPAENSPCSGAGIFVSGISSDIRGYDRPLPQNTNPDIGAYEISTEPLSSTKSEKLSDFKIYPNPAEDLLYLPSGSKNVAIYNLDGSLILTSDSSKIELGGLEEGIYLISFQSALNKVITTKFVISRK